MADSLLAGLDAGHEVPCNSNDSSVWSEPIWSEHYTILLMLLLSTTLAAVLNEHVGATGPTSACFVKATLHCIS